jgi:arylsulfatase
METIDETTNTAMDFMERQVEVNKPFLSWINPTRMPVSTHVQPFMQHPSGMPGNEYTDGMIEHGGHVSQLLRVFKS